MSLIQAMLDCAARLQVYVHVRMYVLITLSITAINCWRMCSSSNSASSCRRTSMTW